jgi:hypothetical protein
MKVTIEFNLPEEAEEHRVFMQASKILYAIQNFDDGLRNAIKYGEHDEKTLGIYEQIREDLYDDLESAGASLQP